MASNRLRILVGMLLALLAMGLARWWLSRSKHVETPQELAQQALQADSPEKQERAAVKLQAAAARLHKTGPRNAAQPYLSRVFLESKNPAVRIPCMMGLVGIWDYECMPAMLDLLDDESAQVRGAAAGAVSQLIGVWKGDFKADDPPEKRKQEAARIRECWKKSCKLANSRVFDGPCTVLHWLNCWWSSPSSGS